MIEESLKLSPAVSSLGSTTLYRLTTAREGKRLQHSSLGINIQLAIRSGLYRKLKEELITEIKNRLTKYAKKDKEKEEAIKAHDKNENHD